jgi:hypothetical protein
MIVQLDSHIVDFLKNDRLLTRGINLIGQMAEIKLSRLWWIASTIVLEDLTTRPSDQSYHRGNRP